MFISKKIPLTLFLATLLLCQETVAIFIRIRPNTFKEFQSIKCHGKFDKEQYTTLTSICEECYNVFRDPRVLIGCKADCFRTSAFPKCTSVLLMDHRINDLHRIVDTVSGNFSQTLFR